ncbi:MAG: hypothetical protein ABI895_36480 [Deltaproteobacteria bacterium]
MSAELSAVQADGPRQVLRRWRGRSTAFFRESWGNLQRVVERGRPLSWLILAAWGVWRLEPFYRVGMASQDQVNFSLQATSDFWGGVLLHARDQGRVYFLLTKIVDLWLAARPEVWRVHAINIVVFALSAPCFALAVFRSRAERLLYVWLFASLAWASYHHMPPAAYPSVNHLPFLLWALAALLVRRESGRGSERSWGTVLGFGVLAFVALFQYEPVAAMSLCVLGWLVYGEPLPALRKRLATALGCAALLYGAIYVGWRVTFPTSYDGAMAGSLSLWNVLRVVIAYGVGALPFCAAYSDAIPIRFSDGGVGESLLRLPAELQHPPGTFVVLFTALALCGLFRAYAAAQRSLAPVPLRLRIGLWALPLLLLLAINGPLGLSAKYQHWVRQLDETYLTSQLALYPLALFGTLVLAALYRRVRVRGVPLAFGALALLVASLSIPVQAHNRRITSLQRANLARWEAVTALAAYASHIEQPAIVAPDLYYSIFVGERSWTSYWGRYVRQRFGGWLSFRPLPPKDNDNFALVRSYRFEDGRLRALSVQTGEYVAIVARPENAPLALVSVAGQGVPLDWRDAEPLGRSSYSAVTLSEPPELLGVDRQIELVWLWPQASLATQRH